MKKYIFNWKVLVGNLVFLASILVICWVLFSWGEVIIHNMDSLNGSPYKYSSYNFFIWMTNILGK